MPLSRDFENRLYPHLPHIIRCFGTPFHIFDEKGILETGNYLKSLFTQMPFQEYFAVKALPTPAIIKLMRQLGFGLDCSSPSELILARKLGFTGEQIMFSSNNTSPDIFDLALSGDGCILNIDDITMIEQVKNFPELICFRYNPGERRRGTQFIGHPVESKYGLRHDQIVPAYRQAAARGARRFGIHSMIISNEKNYQYMVETVNMLLEMVDLISRELDIKFDFINISGGVGIPYRPDETAFDMTAFVKETNRLFAGFREKWSYVPRLYTEFGRFMTGPHGALVTTVINRMSKYREYIGVDAATMTANPRPAIYQSAYHHITILDQNGNLRRGGEKKMDVVGPLCENSDKFAVERLLPETVPGDILVQHDTGAHSPAMTGNYNGWTRPQQLLLRTDGTVELIKRAETIDDLFATYRFEEKKLDPATSG